MAVLKSWVPAIPDHPRSPAEHAALFAGSFAASAGARVRAASEVVSDTFYFDPAGWIPPTRGAIAIVGAVTARVTGEAAVAAKTRSTQLND